MIDLKDVRENLGKLSKPERLAAQALLKGLDINITQNDATLTNQKTGGFHFEDVFYPVSTHREVLLKIAEIALSRHYEEHDKILAIRGPKRRYFSRKSGELSNDNKRIKGSDIYAELNDNAATLSGRCEKVIETYGMDLSSFKIMPF